MTSEAEDTQPKDGRKRGPYRPREETGTHTKKESERFGYNLRRAAQKYKDRWEEYKRTPDPLKESFWQPMHDVASGSYDHIAMVYENKIEGLEGVRGEGEWLAFQEL